MEEIIIKFLRGLSYTQLKYIKENPYLLDEVIYEKLIELKNMSENYPIQSALNNFDPYANNWIDSQKISR